MEYDQIASQQILQLALAKRSDRSQKLSLQQLQEIAADLGVSEAEFFQAAQEWQNHQQLDQQQLKFNQYQKRKFFDYLIKYALVNGALVAIDLLTARRISWSAYVLVFWGLGLGLRAWATFQTHSDSYAREFSQWQEQQRRQQLTSEISAQITDTAIIAATKFKTWLKNRP
ncbi:MAG: 2TM domain-containing protein [Pseudanabaenaceae cyanobacterium bins.68]|nr:2TM domain-containing protein [Pseudanabaenaceae cyanobacterium bins.68]